MSWSIVLMIGILAGWIIRGLAELIEKKLKQKAEARK